MILASKSQSDLKQKLKKAALHFTDRSKMMSDSEVPAD